MDLSSTANQNRDEVSSNMNVTPKKPHFMVLLKLLGGIFIFVVAIILFFPWAAKQMMTANARAVGERGRDIVIAINDANRSRAIAGLPPVWPKTILVSSNRSDDISGKVFQTSSDYFYELYDGHHVDASQHKPYVKGFYYTNLAGAGVSPKTGAGKLEAKNNIWIIAANIEDGDDPRIPVLITRVVDAKLLELVVNQGVKGVDFEKRPEFSKTYLEPFGHKHMVFVYKNGKFRIVRARSRMLGNLFDNKELPPRDPSKPPIVYLMP
jgi:hypothetical protein